MTKRRDCLDKSCRRSMHRSMVGASQFLDLVLQLQFSSLERRQLEVVRAWMSHLIRNLALQGLVLSLELRKVVLQHHVGLSCGYSDSPSVPQGATKSIPNFVLRRHRAGRRRRAIAFEFCRTGRGGV